MRYGQEPKIANVLKNNALVISTIVNGGQLLYDRSGCCDQR
ncbi:MAG TPA: hypothetical protein VK818_15470 [Methylomirabilota bacterium]|nr:hypothetical protein [Methylomirabilota bacterium]